MNVRSKSQNFERIQQSKPEVKKPSLSSKPKKTSQTKTPTPSNGTSNKSDAVPVKNVGIINLPPITDEDVNSFKKTLLYLDAERKGWFYILELEGKKTYNELKDSFQIRKDCSMEKDQPLYFDINFSSGPENFYRPLNQNSSRPSRAADKSVKNNSTSDPNAYEEVGEVYSNVLFKVEKKKEIVIVEEKEKEKVTCNVKLLLGNKRGSASTDDGYMLYITVKNSELQSTMRFNVFVRNRYFQEPSEINRKQTTRELVTYLTSKLPKIE